MTSNSVDGTGTTAAYQLQEPAPAMTEQAAELHPGLCFERQQIINTPPQVINMQTNVRLLSAPSYWLHHLVSSREKYRSLGNRVQNSLSPVMKHGK